MGRDLREVVIVGAGPAGVSAAVQLSRYGIRPMIFERDVVGGLLRTAWLVENHPGFPRGIKGQELAEVTAEHLSVSGAELVREEVVSVDSIDDAAGRAGGLLVVRSAEREVWAQRVIVASGTRPRGLDDLVIPDAARDRVHHESRELWGVRDATIAIVGGGDAALDYAIGLSETNDVTVLVRGNVPRGLPLLVSRLGRRERAAVRTEARVTRVGRSDDGRLALELVGPDGDGAPRTETFDHLLLAVGRDPDDEFLGETVRERAGELSGSNRLLFAGDVRSGVFRQSSIAAGVGTLAAMRIGLTLNDGRTGGA